MEYFSNVERNCGCARKKQTSLLGPRTKLHAAEALICHSEGGLVARISLAGAIREILRRARSPKTSTLAGNVNLKGSRYAMNQLGRDVVLAHHLDRLGQFDAALIDLKTLRGQGLRYIAGCDGAK